MHLPFTCDENHGIENRYHTLQVLENEMFSSNDNKTTVKNVYKTPQKSECLLCPRNQKAEEKQDAAFNLSISELLGKSFRCRSWKKSISHYCSSCDVHVCEKCKDKHQLDKQSQHEWSDITTYTLTIQPIAEGYKEDLKYPELHITNSL